MGKITINRDLARTLLPARPNDSDKNSFGRVGIFAGSSDYSGAPFLSSLSAFKSGAGVVVLYVPMKICDILSCKCTSVIVRGVVGENGTFGSFDERIASSMSSYKAVLIGPGISRSEQVAGFVRDVVSRLNCPIILDADALNNIDCAYLYSLSRKKQRDLVITPHCREYSRLFGKTDKPSDDELKECAAKYGLVIVYKDYITRIATADGDLYEMSNPNSALAKAGSGDVLAGLILSFVSQGLELHTASVLAVYIHNQSAVNAAADKTPYCVTPLDYIDSFPSVFSTLG